MNLRLSLFDYRRLLPASDFILQDRKYRERLSPVSLFPVRASLEFSPEYLDFGNPPKVENGADGCCMLPWRSRRLGKPFSLRPIVLGNVFFHRRSCSFNKRSNDIVCGSLQCQVLSAQSRLSWTTISHILQNHRYPHSLLVGCLATRQAYILSKMGIEHFPPYGVPAYTPVRLIRPMCLHMYHPCPPPLSSHRLTSFQSQQSTVLYAYPEYTSTSQRIAFRTSLCNPSSAFL